MHVEIKKISINDSEEFIELIRLFEVVFEMETFEIPDKKYLVDLLAKDEFIVLIACSEKEVVGGLTAYTIHQYYSTLPLVYIYDLAVKTNFQRQGIGKKLIAGITSYCREKGVQEVFVQADAPDLHAIEFYHSTGATAEDVIHFYYPLNNG